MLINGHELMTTGPKEIRWLWDKMLVAVGLAALVGSSDCGKSLLLRQLAIAIVLGLETFLGIPLVIRRRVVFIVCTEDDKDSLAALLSKQMRGEDPNCLLRLFFIVEAQDVFAEIRTATKDHPPDVIILDGWADTFDDNPNSWVDVRRQLRRLKAIADQLDCLILIIHHTVKNSEKTFADKNKVNGSQAIEAKLRCILELRNGEEASQRELRIIKNNYISRPEKAEGILLQLDSETLTFSNTGQKLSITGSVEAAGTVYDTNLWIGRMAELRETGLSYDKARQILLEKFGANVPSKGWFFRKII